MFTAVQEERGLDGGIEGGSEGSLFLNLIRACEVSVPVNPERVVYSAPQTHFFQGDRVQRQHPKPNQMITQRP